MTENEESVAALLSSARENAGYCLRDIAGELNIRVQYLEAIEDEAFDRLPAPAFTAGFVRCYADFLGLDGAVLARRFRERMGAPNLQPELRFPEPVADSRFPGRSAVLTGLVGLAVMYFGWIHDFAGAEQAGQPRVEPVPERLAGLAEESQTANADAGPTGRFQPAAAEAAAQKDADGESGFSAPRVTGGAQAAEAAPEDGETAPAGTSDAAAAGAEPRVVLKAEEDVWIRVMDSQNREIFAGALRAGETWSPRGGERRLTTSNAGALAVRVDGELLSNLGKRGAVVRDVALEPDHLRETYTLAMH